MLWNFTNQNPFKTTIKTTTSTNTIQNLIKAHKLWNFNQHSRKPWHKHQRAMSAKNMNSFPSFPLSSEICEQKSASSEVANNYRLFHNFNFAQVSTSTMSTRHNWTSSSISDEDYMQLRIDFELNGQFVNDENELEVMPQPIRFMSVLYCSCDADECNCSTNSIQTLKARIALLHSSQTTKRLYERKAISVSVSLETFHTYINLIIFLF